MSWKSDYCRPTTARVLKTYADPDGTIHKPGEILRLGQPGRKRIQQLQKLGYVEGIKRPPGSPKRCPVIPEDLEL